jgi:hypothetical protein
MTLVRRVGVYCRLLMLLCAGSLSLTAHAAQDPAVTEATAAARGVMEAFLKAFNARDEPAWADTLHFPHVRIASGTVTVFPDREAFLDSRDLSVFAEETGWDYSTWDDMQVVQTSAGKVHIAVTFTRFDQQGGKIASYDSLYVIEKLDGRWGVRARSSFAP